MDGAVDHASQASATPAASSRGEVPELTVVMPCLNEAETTGVCIDKARRALAEHGIPGEVVVADNGSSDGSQAIARTQGARVVRVTHRGSSRALMGGIRSGRWTGWHLYSRVALIADCDAFSPPKGTSALCDPRPDNHRPGSNWFLLYDPGSPALRLFGPLGNHDSTLSSVVLRVILQEPGAHLRSTLHEVEGYFVPSGHPYTYGGGCGIDCQVDWRYATSSDPHIRASTQAGMEKFFDRFTVHRSPSGINFLHSYENPFRFGGTLLTVTSLLTVLGLLIGPRRARVGVLLFGVGCIAMLVFPTFGVYYLGRYQVPTADPMAASAAITLWLLWRLESDRRQQARAGMRGPRL